MVTESGRLRVLDGDAVVGDVPVAALVDDCPLYDLEPAAPSAPVYPAPAATLDPGARRSRDAARAARQPEHRLAPAALPAVRLDRAVAHRPPSRRRRRRRAPARVGQRDRGRDRRVRAPRGGRSVHGHDRGRARVRREPRLRRRRAAGADELPELRQPGEAAHRLAALGEHPGPGRRLPRAGRAGRRRQRLALQRGRRRARSTRPPSSGSSAGCPTPRARARSHSRRRATRSAWRARSRRRCRDRARQAARRGAARRAARRGHLGGALVARRGPRGRARAAR